MKIVAHAVLLLASLSSCKSAKTSLLRAGTFNDESATIVDLSQDIPRDEAAISSSPGSKAVQEAAKQVPTLLNFMVIEKGSIVSAYNRDDIDPTEVQYVASVTKGWMSLLLGMLVEDGLLSLDTTLGEIFPNDDAWADVTDGSTDFRKGVTIEELLTMTSGFTNNFEGILRSPGGESLQDSLSFPDIGVKGKFDYLISSNIPSYIVIERTGMTPKQYLDSHVMRKLGVGEDEYSWNQNADGVEHGGGGMHLTPMQMAKFGQLYLQGGRANPSSDESLISQEWIDASFTHHSTVDYSNLPGLDDDTFLGRVNGSPHGYLFYGLYQHSSGSTVYCGFGAGGQLLCVDRDLDRVVIQQRVRGNMELSDVFKILDLACDSTMSFRVPNAKEELSGISSTVESRTE